MEPQGFLPCSQEHVLVPVFRQINPGHNVVYLKSIFGVALQSASVAFE
jgi:hypothetical protein